MNGFTKITIIMALLALLRVNVAIAADQVFYYYTDPAGMPLAMSDSSGEVVWRADYLPFGEETIDTSIVPNNKMFVGKEKDSESGLYYFGARYMDAGAGRFGSPDPIGAVNQHTGEINKNVLNNPQRLNFYAYGLNNPYRFVDPDGADPVDINGNTNSVLRCHINPHNDPKENLIGALIVFAPLLAIAAPELLAAAGDASLAAAIRYPVATAAATEITAGMVGAPSNSPFFANNSTRYFAAQKQVAEILSGQGEAIAGAGTAKVFRNAPRLAAQYGGNISDWAKVKSSNLPIDGVTLETHAYMNTATGLLVEFKPKIQ